MNAKRKPTHSVSSKRKPKKKHPGGWFYTKKKLARVAAAAKASGMEPTQSILPVIVELNTVEHWHTQIADLFKRARIGDMEKADASKLCYIASEGAKLAKSLQELRELEGLRQQLAQLNGGALPPMLGNRNDFISEAREAIDQ